MYTALWGIVRQVQSRVAAEIGDGAFLLNDFVSLRVGSQVMFPTWHQDAWFWAGSGAGDARGFNVWILVDSAHPAAGPAAEEPGHDRAFDVLQLAHNRELCGTLYPSGGGGGAAVPPRLTQQLRPRHRLGRDGTSGAQCNQLDIVDAMKKLGCGSHNVTERGSELCAVLRPTRTRLRHGDALIVHPAEVHRTDQGFDDGAGSWRLALGFKVLYNRTVEMVRDLWRPPLGCSPYTNSYKAFRQSHPSLHGQLPNSFHAGASLPDMHHPHFLAT